MRTALARIIFPGYHQEAIRHFQRMELVGCQSDARFKLGLSNFVGDLHKYEVWPRADFIYPFGAPTEAAAILNVKSSSFTLSKTGTVTHTPGRCIQGDGSTGYYDTSYQPGVTAGVSAAQNSVFMAVYCLNAVTSTSQIDMGNTRTLINSRANSSGISARCMTSGSTSIAAANSTGLKLINRDDSTDWQGYNDGAAAVTASAASEAPSAVNMLIGAWNNAGTPASFSTRQIALAMGGAHLQDAQCTALASICRRFVQAIG